MPEKSEEHQGPKIFNDPISVAKRTRQKRYSCAQIDKNALLEQIIRGLKNPQALVVTKTKRGADSLCEYLCTRGINAVSIHSNTGKGAKEAGAKAFNEGEIDILITTDMILQALALSKADNMLSYDLPLEPEHYLYRMGCLKETAEAIALVSEEEETLLFHIERTMRQEIPEEEFEGFVPTPQSEALSKVQKTAKKKPRHKKTKAKEKRATPHQENRAK